MECNKECLKCIEGLAQRILDLLSIGSKREQIITKVQAHLSQADLTLTPMHISQSIFDIIRTETGSKDPYLQIKNEANLNALMLLDKATSAIKKSNDPLYSALKVSIAGNIIDSGISDNYDLDQTLKMVLNKEPAINDYPRLRKELKQTSSLTLLADNAGEIVFDKLLLDTLTKHYSFDKIRLVVKKHPFINDVTKKDLKGLGFDTFPQLEIIEIDNHSASTYQQQMIEQIQKSDLTISKGQGNLEMIYDLSPGAYFLFIVKCKLIGEEIGAKEGEIMIAYS